jgi:CBS domain containing-hemolysin-like protein
MESLLLLQIVAVVLLILANAFFVAAEFALVSIRETRVEQLLAAHVSGARAVEKLQQGLDELLPAVQLGVTLCSLALGWLGEPLAARLLLRPLSALPHAQVWAGVTAMVLGFALITYCHVVAGELVPKSLALRRAEALALAVAPPMLAFMAATRPAVRLLKGGAGIVLRAFGIEMSERAQLHSTEELKLIASSARRAGLLPELEEKLIHRSLELDDVPVREIMTPRQKIFSLANTMPVGEAWTRLMARHHSRVPVYDDERGPEHIVGVLYARDLARLFCFRPSGPANDPFAALTVHHIMRDVLVVPETKSVLDLLQEFQQRRRQIAIVADEYGSIVGLATAEDAIEQLIGELDDEFDAPAVPALTTTNGALLMEGGVNLRDLETQMQWNLPRDGGVETLAGFLLSRLGHIPEVGESITFDGRRLTVVEMEQRRIARIRVEKLDSLEATPAD